MRVCIPRGRLFISKLHHESLCPTESSSGKIILRSDQRRRKINLGAMKCWGIVVFCSRRGWGWENLFAISQDLPQSASEGGGSAVRVRRAEVEVDTEVQETESAGAGEPPPPSVLLP